MKKKMILSITSIVLTLFCLVSLTYSWFAFNDKVETQGLQITVKGYDAEGSLEKYNSTSGEWEEVDDFHLENLEPLDYQYFRLVLSPKEEDLNVKFFFGEIETSISLDEDESPCLVVDDTNYTITYNDISVYKYYTYDIDNLSFERKLSSVSPKDQDATYTCTLANDGLGLSIKNGNETIASIDSIVINNAKIQSLNAVDGNGDHLSYIINNNGLGIKLINSVRTTVAEVVVTLDNGTLSADSSITCKKYDNTEITTSISDNTITITDEEAYDITLTVTNGKLTGASSAYTNHRFKIDSDGYGLSIIDITKAGVSSAEGVLYEVSGTDVSIKDHLLKDVLKVYSYVSTDELAPSALETQVSGPVNLDAENILENIALGEVGSTTYAYFKISFDSQNTSENKYKDNYYQYQLVKIGQINIEDEN
ncbi:MAG: hypothetical protein K6E74_03205 [Bacilli bacterium]|nr:hypothetical protein [Bacilli bacterium]